MAVETGIGEPAVTLKDAAVAYGARIIWSEASLAVGQGEFIAVLGPNGSGKTSLLKLLLGMLRPVFGEALIFGRPPRRGSRLIGYVPQRRTLDPDLPIRGRDLVKLGASGLRWGFPLPSSSHGEDTLVDGVLEAVEAAGYAGRPIGQMSGGEQQRLLLAQALVGGPRLLLLDEPLANLDLRDQEAITGLVARLARAQRISVLLVTHDINPMLPVMDRVIYIAKGKVVIGTPDEIITSETLSTLYDAPVQVIRDEAGRYLCSGRMEDVHPEPEEKR